MKQRGNARCFGAAWVAGWAVAVFLPSVLIAVSRIPPGGLSMERIMADGWQVADAMAPGAKLLLGGLLFGLFLAAERAGDGRRRAVTVALCASAGMAAMLLTLMLIPAAWSRGFGIGVTGARLSAGLLPFYLGGAALAGIVQVLTAARCRATLGRA